MRQFAQGDLLFIERPPVVPTDLKPKPDCVIAFGEKTGHAHVNEGGEVYDFGAARKDIMMVLAFKGAIVRHPEHPPLELPEGAYDVRRQRFYDYAKAVEKTVAD